MESEEESEDDKMEKFFALIRSTREVRELITGSLVRPKEEGGKKPKEEKSMVPSGWNPSFQPEDFTVDTRLKTIHRGSLPGPSKKREDDNKEEEEKAKEKAGDGIDLNLSL